MKYECDLVKDLLPLYHDKAASSFSSKIVEEHLNECDDCRLYYQDVSKTTNRPFETIEKTDETGGYLPVAKRLRRTKWYWRLCIAVVVGVVIFESFMYAEGNRFDPMKAAYASHLIDNQTQLVATVPVGNERLLYIYDNNGEYQGVDVVRNFVYWKYEPVSSNRHIADPDAGVQLIAGRTYANSNNHSLYIVYAVAVNDNRVAAIELGKEGAMQRQNVESKSAVFLWDESEKWDGTDTWEGMITQEQLRGTAYAIDGSVLYHFVRASESDGQDSFQWVPIE